MITGIIIAAIAILLIASLIVFLKCTYKVADVDKALIVTGGKEPKIKVSGGSFIIPIIRKASFFDLCMLTVRAGGDEVKTKSQVPIIVDWTAQIRPDSEDVNILKKAIVSFKERDEATIKEDIKQTLMGAVRGVVAEMTPEEVQADKEAFKQKIVASATDELSDMGFRLVSLNVQEVTDNNGYYDAIATIDKEEKRYNAEQKKAITEQQIRQQKAVSEKEASEAELMSKLAVAEKTRDNKIKEAQFKAETDRANADAEVAGELQKTIRNQEVEVQKGKVEVIRQEQANLAAEKAKDVEKTKAETEKVKAEIKAQEEAAVATINAQANAEVAEREAEGKAKAVEKEAQANANKIRLEGETEADIISKKGMAEAEAIKAKKLAEAEGEKALAEARAGNDKVNFEIEKLKIDAQARVTIATKTAEIMAEIGKHAEFVNISNSSPAMPGSTGNVLLDTLKGVPALMKCLDAENMALNGKSFNDEARDLVSALVGPVKGILASDTTNNTTNNTTIESPPVVEVEESDKTPKDMKEHTETWFPSDDLDE